MKTFPIMLSGSGLRAVVVGGGHVGLRKARALLRAGAAVTMIDAGRPGEGLPSRRAAGQTSRSVADSMAATVAKARGNGEALRVLRRAYEPSMLAGARLVLACTNDRDANRRIAADARAAGALVNVADQPDDCDFFLPAVVADGNVVIAVGTGGLSPALAASLKRGVAAALPKGTGRFAALLARMRRELKAAVPDAPRRMAILRRLAREDVYEEFLAGGAKAVRRRVRLWTQSGGQPGPDGIAPREPAAGDGGALARTPRIMCVGVSHKTAPLALRERLAMDGARSGEALADLSARWPDGRFAVLSTCNRTEVYCSAERTPRGLTGAGPTAAGLRRWLAGWRRVEASSLGRAAYSLRGRRAAEHLFRVAAGLESLVPGEPQIVHQLKEAFAASAPAGANGGVLAALFQTALHVAKHARSRGGAAGGDASVASVAVDCVIEALGWPAGEPAHEASGGESDPRGEAGTPLRGRSILVIGGGRMASGVLGRLRAAGAEDVRVAGRSIEKINRLARRLGASAVAWEAVPGELARVDAVLSAAAASKPILTRRMLAQAGRRRNATLTLVDIGVPRNIEAGAGRVDGVRLFDIDDLRGVVRRTLRSRRAQQRRAEAVVREHVDDFVADLAARRVAPAIKALYRRMQAVADAELAEARHKLAGHADAAEDEAVLQRTMHRAIRRMLHPAAVNLRRLATSDSAHLHVQSIRHLFGLGN
jgi:glutamyl-tRNA reductase